MLAAKEAYRNAMRAELVAAAQRAAERTGLAGLTIREVLAEAGVAPGTLYSYFSSKEDILQAMVEEFSNQYLARMAQSGFSEGDMVSFIKGAFTTSPEGADFLTDLRSLAGDEQYLAALRRLNEDVVAFTRPGIDHAVSPAGSTLQDRDAFAELLDIIWDGMSRRAKNATFVTSYERVGDLVISLLLAPLMTAGNEQERGSDPDRK